ncbi:MAG: hypothetical protein ACRD3M_11010 [Thermoanaerobaculia bacterium]
MSAKNSGDRPDGWAAHAEEQRRARLRLTPAERLAWLEQAKEFAAQAQRSSRGQVLILSSRRGREDRFKT